MDILAVKNSKLFQILNQVSDPVFLLNSNLEFIWANDAYCSYMGIDSNKIRSMQLKEVIPAEYVPVLTNKYKAITTEKPTFDNIYPSVLEDGSIIIEKWHNEGVFDKKGNLDYYYCIATMKGSGEEEPLSLNDSDLISNTLIKSALLGIIIAIDQKIQYINRKAYELLFLDSKTSFDQADLNSFFKAVFPYNHSRLLDNDKNQNAETHEIAIQINGVQRWISVIRKYQLYNSIDTALFLFEDITDRKEIEESLRKARDKAEESERLKTAFLANMSHEIRTPLNAILGFSDLLTRTDSATEKKNFRKIINQSSKLLLKIIDDILNLSAIESGSFELFYEKTRVNRIFDDLEHFYSDNDYADIELNIKKTVEEIRFAVDIDRLKQILINLINNAFKYTKRGSITVSGRKDEDDNIVFSVKDTGTGIEPDQIGFIFERFYQSDSFSKGTGLGLAISKSIIEQMGGEISVVSEPEKGSEFIFYIPAK